MTSLTVQSLLARHTELADASRIALVAAQTAAISVRTSTLPGGIVSNWQRCQADGLATAAMEAHAEAHVAKELYLEALAASAQPLVGSLATPQDRIECRDAATQAWHEWDEDGDQPLTAFVCDAIRALGMTVGYAEWSNYGKPLTVVAGTKQIVLEWDPMIDGFDYEGSTEDAEALEPADEDDTTCTCGDKRGMGTDDDGACRDCGGYA